MTLLLVALVAGVGGALRYLSARFAQAGHGGWFAWGTLTVNVAGSLLLGFLVGLPVEPWLAALLGTGFCGALTTYSTFSFEILGLTRAGQRVLAGAYAVGSVLAGLGAAAAGMLTAGALP